MNRRNFFKVVTGFVAGIFATNTVKAKPKALTCRGKSGTLCPRCKFNCKSICRPKSGPPGPTEIPAIWSQQYPLGTRRSGMIYIKAAKDIIV